MLTIVFLVQVTSVKRHPCLCPTLSRNEVVSASVTGQRRRRTSVPSVQALPRSCPLHPLGMAALLLSQATICLRGCGRALEVLLLHSEESRAPGKAPVARGKMDPS